MKFFIDTANLEDIKTANDLGILDGVTTNPSLMSKEGTPKSKINDHYKKICDIIGNGKPVSAEVISTKYDEMVAEGQFLSNISPNIVVKIPMTIDGLKAIKELSRMYIDTNCTLIFTPGQALLAAKAGATYVSPFIGRLDDTGIDGLRLIEQIRNIFDNYQYDTQILAASVRNVGHIINCAEIGADVMTGPLKSMLNLVNHPLTDKGLEKFLEDYNKLSE